MDKSEISDLLVHIDAELARHGYTIPQRPIHAVMKVGHSLGLPLPMTKPKQDNQNPSAVNWPIVESIYQWYENRYGDRIKKDFSPGTIAVPIRDDVYIVKLPAVYGTVSFYAKRERNPKPQTFSQERIAFNVLDAFKDLADGLREALTDEELQHIQSLFVFTLSTITKARSLAKNEQLMSLALADINTSANHLNDNQREYGLSKWASLQAAEKSLKHVILSQTGSHPHGHNLKELYKDARSHGLSDNLQDAITYIQCSAGVRYGEESVPRGDALDAHHASIVILNGVTELIERNKP
ncbi:HEPN domain-containing protein [Thioalkalivibrio sp. ALJ2]|uniref:HEPN domain-containing protein n=1 Tax=Thioalkalivibrio sp. ALJ2 TaxID=1261622 RepID=UPI0009D9CBD7|nr:HEPN domain-containing protein [Thioalkalivibrio sp. ALJ2]